MSNRPICGTDTPDPWIVAAHGKFYLTFTLGNRVEIWQSPHLEDFRDSQKSVIWVRSFLCSFLCDELQLVPHEICFSP